MCVFTLQDLRKQLENAERLYQTQMEQCKKLEREKENLEKTSGVLCNEKQNVDSKIQELASELATVREKASAMEAQHKQKICALDAEITTLKKELSESVLQVCVCGVMSATACLVLCVTFQATHRAMLDACR